MALAGWLLGRSPIFYYDVAFLAKQRQQGTAQLAACVRVWFWLADHEGHMLWPGLCIGHQALSPHAKKRLSLRKSSSSLALDGPPGDFDGVRAETLGHGGVHEGRLEAMLVLHDTGLAGAGAGAGTNEQSGRAV